MPSWDELQEHARKTYALSQDEEDYFALVWTYENERTQQIIVNRFESFGQDWVRFRTFVCAGTDLNPTVALRKNEGFALGALALDADGDYCLIHSAALATLDPEEFTLPLSVLARTADSLEAEHSAQDTF
jgi:hypothetical protein